MSDVSDVQLVHAMDQLGAKLRERLSDAGVDPAAVVWAAREQMHMIAGMAVDADPDDELLNGACGLAAWWACVVGTGLGAQDLVVEAQRWWTE